MKQLSLYSNTYFVEKQIFTLEQLICWMSSKPAELFNLAGGILTIGAPADITIFDLEKEEVIDEEQFESMGKNTPFIGRQVKGNTMMTFVDGQLVWSKEGI